VAAFCFARAGRFERARELSRESAAQAGRLGPHRALHAASAETLCLLPTGRFDALGEATEHVARLAAADPNGACTSVEIALCGRAAWLHEAGRDAEALELAALVDTARVGVRPSPDPYVCIEILLPLLGVEACRERLEAVPGPDDVTMTVHRLRAELQVHAVAREWDEVDRLVAAAREIAGPACASALASIADWAAAMRLAGAGRAEEAVTAARSATDALEEFGERYTAERLLADLVPLLPPDRRRALAAPVAERLEQMGAHASAARATLG
jgi:hypothetical protein